MPIYEYECQKCKTHIEILQKISDKPLSKCPKCRGKLEKQWSNTSFQFKGSGWYVTDYAGKKAASESSPSGESATPASDTKQSAEKATEPKKKSPTKTPVTSTSGD